MVLQAGPGGIDARTPAPDRRRHRSSGRRERALRQVRLVDDPLGELRPSARNDRLAPFSVFVVLGAVATGGVSIWLHGQFLGSTVTSRVDGATEGVAAILCAIACALAAQRRSGRLRWSLRSIGLGILAWGFGQGAWSYFTVANPNHVPFPSLADFGFLAAIPLWLVGFLVFPVEPTTALSRLRVSLDGVIVTVSLFTISWAAVLDAFVMSKHSAALKAALSLAYPLADLVLLTVVLSALAHSSRQRRVPLALLALGTGCLTVADSGFFYLTQISRSPADSQTDIGWIACFFLFACAALWPQRPVTATETHSRVSIWQTVIPYALLAVAAGADGIEYGLHHHLDIELTGGGLVLVAVVLVRQVLIVAENQRLTTHLEEAVATLRAEETELSRLALHDPLTGLANRLLFTERLQAALALAEAGQRRVAVVFCDLDGFKDANDSLGHSAGDAMLVGVAERLLACVRPEDTVARLGGDEFAIVLEDLDDLSDASRVAGRIVETMRDPLTVGTEHFLLHVSIGIALASEGSYGIEELLRDADIALYAAKNAGGNRYRMFDSTMGIAYLDRLRLEADLGTALERSELFLEYQPIIHLARNQPIGVEALLRWRHPIRGLLQPASFLATAERSGSIVSIGKWVLEESLAQLRNWQQEMLLPPGFSIAVNLSVRQLEAGDLVSSVERAIFESGIDPRAVRLELTETALIDRAEASIDLLHALRRLGVHLEIDDFGTGYSSLDYLRRLPLDILKIDQSFIIGLGSDPHDTLIVETIINLAHALGMTVVAEGVETPLQLARLRALGCDFGQGFYWSRSLDSVALASWITEATRSVTPATWPAL